MKTVRTTYTCDLCGGDAGYNACRGDPPSAEAYFAVGLFGAGDTSKASFNDLCRSCYDALNQWLREAKQG